MNIIKKIISGYKTVYGYEKDGEFIFHSENDCPAVIHYYENPHVELTWYKHGKMHRDVGPAHTSSHGYEIYMQDGERHRDYGPAVIYSDRYLEGQTEADKKVNPVNKFEYWQHGKLIKVYND